LCSLGDTVIEGTPRAFSFEVPDDFLLVFVVEKLLETMPAPDRATALQTAMESAGVSTVAMIVMFLGAQHGRHGEQASLPDERTIPSETDLDTLEGVARQRIVRASADGTLWTAARFPRVLFDWKRLGGEAPMREVVGQWCADDGNLIRLIELFKGPAERGREGINTGVLSELLDLDATVRRAKKLLAEPTIEPKAHDVLRLLLEAYASTEAARSEQRARARVLSGILQEIDRTGWYPTMHWVRTTFEADRSAIDRLAEERMIQHVLEAQYMITIVGLQQVRSDSCAHRDLRVCAMLIATCQDEYRKNDKARIDLEQMATQVNDKNVDANALRRAALILLVNQTPGIQLEWSGAGGLPIAVFMRDAILNVSPQDIVGTGS
jgi:hypothetical protein